MNKMVSKYLVRLSLNTEIEYHFKCFPLPRLYGYQISLFVEKGPPDNFICLIGLKDSVMHTTQNNISTEDKQKTKKNDESIFERSNTFVRRWIPKKE